ncbi:hypothetical protein [Flagellimonas onchidii]|uniref:hypothetical protein n=1 Tax=Flagellimonas onchidii TaxID=2562684 RepID=UPI0010A5BBE6|nr:hypothetical protein [Allomuricauda onchidii]
MKNIVLLFPLALLFLNCLESTNTKKESVETKNKDVELLSLDGKPNKPLIVFITGDEEYRSEEAMPQMAKILNQHHGFNCKVLFAQNPDKPGIINPNYKTNIPGLENLVDADLMVIFTRFRALPDHQMKFINDYLKKGKPVMGIRTATHAFHFTEKDSLSSFGHYGNYNDDEGLWQGGFGRLVLGENWVDHHGNHGHQSTRGLRASNMEKHPLWNGIEEDLIWGPSDVYEIRLPLPESSKAIVMGQTIDRLGEYDKNDSRLGMRRSDTILPKKIEKNGRLIDQNNPMMPIVWTKSYQIPGGQEGRSLTSTIGAAVDLIEAGTRRMIVNGVFYLLNLEVPEKANVEAIGDYNPSAFGFKDDSYWQERNLTIAKMK